MPEIRYIEEYKDGQVVNKIPYQVSDEELGREAAERIVAQLSALPDSELTTAQMKKLVKALARLRR